MKKKSNPWVWVFNLIICSILQTSCIDKIGETTQKDYVIKIDTSTIYARALMWGMTGDHIEILFSVHPFQDNFLDTSSCILYYEPTIYYKISNDSLFLYPNEKNEIPKSFSNIKILQIVLNKYDEITRYKEKYQEYGLKKISVYD